ncbi:hypothetical protein RSK60_160014 [Ralstonia solanacearum K60]|nr:hypothetical protein RSK60_160014 [Ralstonia solanacearum K60]
MTPDTQHNPTVFSQAIICVEVAYAIGLNFLSPELSVLLGPRAVYRAAMPKTTVHKNGYFQIRKSNVGYSAGLF